MPAIEAIFYPPHHAAIRKPAGDWGPECSHAALKYIRFLFIRFKQKALNEHNFDIIEQMFSDNMRQRDEKFTNLVHSYTEKF